MGGWVRQIFDTPGDYIWICPAGIFVALVYGIGAGGGGGRGLTGNNTTNNSAPGGSGGGAAIETFGFFESTPGVSYTLTVGAAGAGSTSPGVNGGDGGSSYVWPTLGTRSNRLLNFVGAMGGVTPSGMNQNPPGGLPAKFSVSFLNGHHNMHGQGGYGGFSTGSLVTTGGKRSPGSTFTANSAGGLNGSNSGSFRGGGGSGGGGTGIPTIANVGGAGGAGVNGGSASAGTGVAGGNGNAGTGHGSGGSGGSGGGCGGSLGGNPGNGALGAPGRLILMYYLG